MTEMSSGDPRALKSLEREALRIAASGVPDPARREALERQLDALCVRARDYTGAGFYIYFTCPYELRSPALPHDSSFGSAAAFSLDCPERHEGLLFLVYTRDGLIDFLEGVSSGSWYEEFASAGRWQESDEPILFDPARIKFG